MRIWDFRPELLCRAHLLGEHRELHAIWNILTQKKKGYSRHPETIRWQGRLRALYNVHEEITSEMKRRGYSHKSLLDETLATGSPVQDTFVDPPEMQSAILRAKGCGCRV